MTLKHLCQVLLLSVPALPVSASVVTPAVVQSSMSSGPSAAITLTLPNAPTTGNMLFAVVGFGIYGDRTFNPPDSSWNCIRGAGGSVRINTCWHNVVSGDGASYTFTPTSTDGPGVEAVLFEASGTVSAQFAYSYSGDAAGKVSVTDSPTLTPFALGMLPLAFTSGGDLSAPGQAGWTTMQTGGGLGAFVSNTITTDTTTPVSTTFTYVNNNEGNSLQELMLLTPGKFATSPVASPAEGTYARAQQVVLSDALQGAVIHYTVDGTVPDCSSAVYGSPLTVATTETVRFLACATGYSASPVRSATYVVAGGTLGGVSLGPMADLHGFVPFAGDLFHKDISAVPVDANSANILAGIGAGHIHHDWSSVNGGNYGIPYIVVDSHVTPLVPFTNQLYSDESDLTLYPIPAGLPIESTPADCTITGDNHAIILDKATGVDYEFYRAQHCPGSTPEWQAANGVLWDMTTIEQRPYAYTSVDAAGLSVFEGLVRYDEIVAGAINHAIRFTTALTRCDHYNNGDGIGAFVAPATHAACNNSGTLNVMGMRLRLKADFDISGFSPTNQIILTAMKKYGMILADNGSSLYFQGTPDARWDDDDLTALDAIRSTSLEVIQMPQVYTNDSHPSGPAPVIAKLAAASATITAGQSVTLVSQVAGASYSYIDRAGFMRDSSVTVKPTETTTYTLTSRNAYGSTSAATTVTVMPAANQDPGLTIATVPTKTAGDTPFTLSATSASTGQITYSVVSGPASVSGNTVTVLGEGTVVVQASQAAAGTYTAATATTTFTVTGVAPRLTFSPVADRTYGAVPFPVTATSNSSGAISYGVVSGPATMSNNVVTLTGAGTVTLQASQAAAGQYSAAVAQVSFVVKGVTPTLRFVPIGSQVYGVAPFAVSSTSNSNGGDTYSVTSGPATLAGNTLTVTGVGKVVLMVSQAAAGSYTAATATTSFSVTQAAPQLTFAAIAPHALGDAPFALSATSLSPAPITYSLVLGPGSLAGNMLTLNGAGTIILLATQPATVNYTAGFGVTSLTVKKPSPALSLILSNTDPVYLTQVAYEVRLGMGLHPSPTGQVQILDGTQTLGVLNMKLTDGGDLVGTMPATLTIGLHTLTAVYVGDANYSGARSAPVVVTVHPKIVRIGPARGVATLGVVGGVAE